LEAVPPVPDKEIRLDRIYKREALAYIVSHPWREVILGIKKLCIFWAFDPNHEKGKQPMYWVPSVLLSLTAAAGLFVGTRPPLRELGPMLTAIGFSMLLGIVFFVLPRYKIAIDPFLCVFAANAGSYLPLTGRPATMDR
jgi:hypothetical protein